MTANPNILWVDYYYGDMGRYPSETINLACSYCWQQHAAPWNWREVPVEEWHGCGPDLARYFVHHEDYIAYVRWYKANGSSHDRARQLDMFGGGK